MRRPGVPGVVLSTIAGFIIAFVGCLHVLALASGMVGDFSSVWFKSGAAEVSASAAAVPGMLFWGFLWTIFGWLTGGGWRAIAMAAVSLAWLAMLPGFENDDGLVFALMVATSLVAAWLVAHASVTRPSSARVSGTWGRGFVIGCFLLGLVLLVMSCSRTAPSTNNLGLIAMCLLALIPLLPSAYRLGYYLPGILDGAASARRGSIGLVALLPLIAIAPAVAVIATQQREITRFSHGGSVEFVSYLDREVARCASDREPETQAAGPGFVAVRADFNIVDRRVGGDLDARLPINWTPAVGLRRPVRFQHFDYVLDSDDAGDPIESKYDRTLPDRAKLDWLLMRIGASTALKNANWRLEPRDQWRDPYTQERDDRFRSWRARCHIGGRNITIRALSGWRVEVSPT